MLSGERVQREWFKRRMFMPNAAEKSSKARTVKCPLDSATRKMQKGSWEPWGQKP